MLNNKNKPTLVYVSDCGIVNKIKRAKYRCHCGKEFIAAVSDVKRNHTKSCGCYNIKRIKERMTKHSGAYSRLYSIWKNMKTRCYNDNYHQKKDYKDRGIIICCEWLNDFSVFEQWALLNGYSYDLEIDRINVNGNYEPSNCRWVTSDIQSQNTRVLRVDNTSGYRGVHARNNKFYVKICVSRKQINLGIFKDAIEAAKAYNDYVVNNGLEHPLNIINDLH